MPETKASGWTIHYETHGDTERPPLLMTLGLSHRLAHWGRLPSMLADRLFVVTFNCRGMGASERRDEAYTVVDETGDMAAVLDSVGLQAAAVYGRSRGGILAQEFALQYPERVTSLILSGTHFGGPGVAPAARRVTVAMQLRPEMTREQIFATQNEAMAAPGWAERDPEAFAYCLSTDLDAPPRRFAVDRQRGAIAAWSSRDRLGSLTVPTLVLCGADDGMVPPENSRNLATRIPGARLELIPQCGHLPMLEKPESVAGLVFEHLEV